MPHWKKAEGEDALPHLAGTELELVIAICPVMISELQEEIQAELRLVCKDVEEVHTNNTKFLNYISVCLKSIESTMPSADISDEVAQLQKTSKLQWR